MNGERDPGPLKFENLIVGAGWIPLGDGDATMWERLERFGDGRLVHDRYCYVRNRRGGYDRWRGSHHPPDHNIGDAPVGVKIT